MEYTCNTDSITRAGMTKIAIDLTRVRVGKVGGTEFYVRNLLTGIGELGRKDFAALLLLAAGNFYWICQQFRKKCFV